MKYIAVELVPFIFEVIDEEGIRSSVVARTSWIRKDRRSWGIVGNSIMFASLRDAVEFSVGSKDIEIGKYAVDPWEEDIQHRR